MTDVSGKILSFLEDRLVAIELSGEFTHEILVKVLVVDTLVNATVYLGQIAILSTIMA